MEERSGKADCIEQNTEQRANERMRCVKVKDTAQSAISNNAPSEVV